MKTGIITDGISRDFEHALSVTDEYGLEYAELQSVWDKEDGFLEHDEVKRVKELLKTAWEKSVQFLPPHLRWNADD